MASIIIPSRWQRVPPYAPAFNPSHFAYSPKAKVWTRYSRFGTDNQNYFHQGAEWFGHNTSGGASGWVTPENMGISGSQPRTYWGRTSFPDLFAYGGTFFAHGRGGVSNSYIAIINSAGSIIVDLWSPAWGSGYASSNLQTAGIHDWALVYVGGTTFRFYHRGVRVDTGAAAGGTPNTIDGPLLNSSYTGANQTRHYLLGVVDRALSDAEVRELYREPYAVVAPPASRPRIFVALFDGTATAPVEPPPAQQQPVAKTATTSLAAAIRAARTATASINAAIRDSRTSTASLAAAVSAGYSATASLTSAIQEARTASVSVAAAIRASRLLSAALDASISALAARYARPAQDSVDGDWTPSTGADLYACIDEEVRSDTDYIETTVASTCKIKLSGLTDPLSSTGHKLRFAVPAGFTPVGQLTASLYQGASTLIASMNVAAPAADTVYTMTLSAGEADSITDYTDLYVWLTAS